jgi:hypothetical protein
MERAQGGFSEGDSCDLTGGSSHSSRPGAGPRRRIRARRCRAIPTHDIFVAKVTAAAALPRRSAPLPEDATSIIAPLRTRCGAVEIA